MVNPFARGAGIAAIVLIVLSAICLVAQNGQLEHEENYELALEQAAVLSWWCTFTFLLAVGAFAIWTLLRGVQWIAARIAPEAFAKVDAPPAGIGEAEASARLSGTSDAATRAD